MLLSFPQSIVIRGESDSHEKGPIISHFCLEHFKTPVSIKVKARVFRNGLHGCIDCPPPPPCYLRNCHSYWPSPHSLHSPGLFTSQIFILVILCLDCLSSDSWPVSSLTTLGGCSIVTFSWRVFLTIVLGWIVSSKNSCPAWNLWMWPYLEIRFLQM